MDHVNPLLRAPRVLAISALLVTLAACGGGAPGGTTSTRPSASAGAASSAPAAASPTAIATAVPTPEPSVSAGETITIRGASFGVAEVTVAVGDTLTFTNASTLPHTVTEGANGAAVAGARFDQSLPPGSSTEITFAEAGDYAITCHIHATMNMVVHVGS